jgi:hypothetical protein
MIPLIKDERPQMGEYAIECLALLGHSDGLVKTLAFAEYLEMRAAAIAGLRTWLPRHPDERPSFRMSAALAFPEDSSQDLERLLWGFLPSDAHDPAVSRQLVDWMDDRSVAIRELAFGEVVRLSGDLQYGYQPGYSESIRKRALDRWDHHLEKEGALVAPPSAPSEK